MYSLYSQSSTGLGGVVVISLVYRLGNCPTEGWSNLPKVLQSERDVADLGPRMVWVQALSSLLCSLGLKQHNATNTCRPRVVNSFFRACTQMYKWGSEATIKKLGGWMKSGNLFLVHEHLVSFPVHTVKIELIDEWGLSQPHILWSCIMICFTLFRPPNPLPGLLSAPRPTTVLLHPCCPCGSGSSGGSRLVLFSQSKHPAANTCLWNTLNTRQKKKKNQTRQWKEAAFCFPKRGNEVQETALERNQTKPWHIKGWILNDAFRSSDKCKPERTYWNGVFASRGVANNLVMPDTHTV